MPAAPPSSSTTSAVPAVVPVLLVLALVVAGALVPGWGWVFLALATAVLAGVLALTWPRLTPPERLLRLAVVALVLAVTVVRAFPR